MLTLSEGIGLTVRALLICQSFLGFVDPTLGHEGRLALGA